MNINLNILKQSIANSGDVFDKAYIKTDNLVISENPKNLNKLQQANANLRDSIAAYKVVRNKNATQKLQNEIVADIILSLKTKGMNLSEFVSYWSVKDVSYSAYAKLSDASKKKFLKEMLQFYLTERDSIYRRYGYTDVSLQVKADSASHKASGSLSAIKIADMLKKFGFKEVNKDFKAFMAEKCAFALADKNGKKLLDNLISALGLKFEWKELHEGKYPDFIIKSNNHLFILEHKHKNESGGGQNGQVNEIIDFISHSESNDKKVSYVSFLDGRFFFALFCGLEDINDDTVNNIKGKKISCKNKTQRQQHAIVSALAKNPNNFFVNTFGFEAILKSLKKL